MSKKPLFAADFTDIPTACRNCVLGRLYGSTLLDKGMNACILYVYGITGCEHHLCAVDHLSNESRMTTLQEIITAVKSLSPADRLRLVDTVWDETSPDTWPKPSAEWIEEVQRRSSEYDAGRMTALPWPQVQARARLEAGLDG
jgi:putative addiction module component (TIGR02574 family)